MILVDFLPPEPAQRHSTSRPAIIKRVSPKEILLKYDEIVRLADPNLAGDLDTLKDSESQSDVQLSSPIGRFFH
jgi:hypothetical protein